MPPTAAHATVSPAPPHGAKAAPTRCCQRSARPGASKPPGMSPPARLSRVASAGFADRDEFEYRMAGRLGDENIYRGVLARLEVGPCGRGDTNVTLQDRPCLCGRELPEGVVVPVTAASEPDLPGG